MAWDADASEKVVCRIAAEEGLVARRIGKRICCSSCGGEIAEASLSMLAGELGVTALNMRWAADIAEMEATDGKAYLSPVIDLFDGMIAVRGGAFCSPNALLANTMLKSAVSELPEGLARSSARVGRVQRRWNGRIGLMGRCGFVRSMSWRSCSLDNAAAGVLRTARGRDVR
ncbi:hypothetical protein [Adlercreutzia mucosicola]|uniref:hypothetical protein n=1 Tax=Adlercreutzia mucosicola TaxID=580026 RepID=UPI002B24063B|nr:hypothetical protein [Adlercreutzia mucosicola]MEB1814803.1 hypothetical protein [Adlercreutzia mucosicola]